jgi:stearoyl-CoA desaturase (delta-9 desaturase)
MTGVQRTVNILGVLLPFVGFVLAIVLLWDKLVGPETLAVAAAMYLISGFGVTVGFHRLLAHRAFVATPAIRLGLAAAGTMAMMGPPVRWVTNHRKHHAYADEEGDPHSPSLSGLCGVRGAIAGLWHAHLGWIFTGGRAEQARYARDLLNDPVIMFVNRTAGVWIALGLALPFMAGFVLGGTLAAAVIALLWGGPVRIFLGHHITFSINSLCHFMGRRRFETDDKSRNIVWLAPLSLGEAWHNNHHAFPTSAFHGLRRRDIDPGGWLITALERCHLAWDVVRIAPERQHARRAAGQVAVDRLRSGARPVPHHSQTGGK